MRFAEEILFESGMNLTELQEAKMIEVMANYALAAMMDSSIRQEAEQLAMEFSRSHK